ncbi:hypothetical protein SMICM17S_04801 [Streptomyces microflavus]
MSQLSEFVVHVGRRLRLRPRRVRVLLEVGCPAQRIGHRRDRRPTAGRDDRGGITRITRNRPLRLVAELAGDHRYLAAHTVEQGLRRGGVLQLLSCHGDGLSRSIGVVRTRFVPCLASAVVAALGDQAPLVVRGRRLGPRLSHQPVVERVGRLVPVDMVEGLRRDDGRTVPAGLVREGLSGRVRKGRRRAGRHPDLCSAAERVVRCHGDPAVGIGHLLRQPAQRVNIGGHLMAERVGDHSLGRYLAHRRRVDGPGGLPVGVAHRQRTAIDVEIGHRSRRHGVVSRTGTIDRFDLGHIGFGRRLKQCRRTVVVHALVADHIARPGRLAAERRNRLLLGDGGDETGRDVGDIGDRRALLVTGLRSVARVGFGGDLAEGVERAGERGSAVPGRRPGPCLLFQRSGEVRLEIRQPRPCPGRRQLGTPRCVRHGGDKLRDVAVVCRALTHEPGELLAVGDRDADGVLDRCSVDTAEVPHLGERRWFLDPTDPGLHSAVATGHRVGPVVLLHELVGGLGPGRAVQVRVLGGRVGRLREVVAL